MSRTLLIEPRDPVIFRDGKPFGATDYAKSLPFATPSAIAGTIRTILGQSSDFDEATVQRLLEVTQTGPFLACPGKPGAWTLAFPAPADAVCYEAGKDLMEVVRLQPKEDRYSNIPEGLLSLYGAREGKPASESPRFWRLRRMMDWLRIAHGECWNPCASADLGPGPLAMQRRVHVSIDMESQAAADGQLFSTEGLEFQVAATQLHDSRPLAMVSRVSGPALESFGPLPTVAPVGGECRLALWSEAGDAAVQWPDCPENISKETKRIRAILATPAPFCAGWKPAWLDAAKGCVPGHVGLVLHLKAAAIARPQPLSGWDLQAKGAKPTRFLAPAGSVFFFEVDSGNPRDLWLRSICDREQDRRDGFGLVLIGEW